MEVFIDVPLNARAPIRAGVAGDYPNIRPVASSAQLGDFHRQPIAPGAPKTASQAPGNSPADPLSRP
ncbi:hypothetical protein, partial [Xanthomonas citri]|uniref:hypothetical protein n=1 Tax=Xanthomonas citri TaxID=346 RepID=UPI001F236D1C